MIAFIRNLWRSHKVKAAERRTYRDQRYVPGHGMEDAQRGIIQEIRHQN
jgi:hypothetical protein